MTWVKGTTTWGNLSTKLTQLICGEVADDVGTTVAVGDRWIREFVGQDTIRTPATLDVNTGSISNRAGYWSQITGGANTNMLPTAGMNNVARQTAAAGTVASATLGRWVVVLTVNVANTVASTYNTAQIGVMGWDADTGTQFVNSTLTPSAGGVLTFASSLGTMQVTFSDPSGFLTANTIWARAFTTAYPWGIDFWPMYYRRAGTATFTVNPPGTQTTDWDFVEAVHFPFSMGNCGGRSSLFSGIGIKTSTGASGTLYTLSFPMAMIKGRIFNSTSNGILGLDVGQSRLDTVNGNVMRNQGGYRTQNWCKAFTTAGSVSASSNVQYFMSVLANGIMLALNGDTAATGKLGTAFFGALTPFESTYDVFPVAWNYTFDDQTSASASATNVIMAGEYNYLALRRRQDGSEGSRDWQTKWMRADGHYSGCPGGFRGSATQADVTAISFTQNANNPPALTPITASDGFPLRMNKPMPDGRWPLLQFQWWEGSLPWVSSSSAVDENRLYRGYSDRWYYLPSDGWGNGDELTDTAAGRTYLLTMADYPGNGLAPRQLLSAVLYGGCAIPEL